MDASINWQSFFFLLFGLIASVFAIGVVLTSNVVRMAFYLILSLGATSGLFFLAGADFVGAMQLMIYVGGTLVLLVFGVMLTAQSPFISIKTRGGEWIVAAVVGGMLFLVLVQRIVSIEDWYGPKPVAAAPQAEHASRDRVAARPAEFVADADHAAPAEKAEQETVKTHIEILRDSRTATRIGMALSGPRVDSLDQPNPLLRQGMSSYVLPFEIVSVHLLVVLIGSAYLARAKRRASRGALNRS